jgi:hypothetical protein
MKTNKVKVCPYCGATVAYNATACPTCGSDERTGWSDKTYLDGIDVGDDIDYEEITRKEFSPNVHKPRLLHVIVVSTLLILFIVMLLRSILG